MSSSCSHPPDPDHGRRGFEALARLLLSAADQDQQAPVANQADADQQDQPPQDDKPE